MTNPAAGSGPDPDPGTRPPTPFHGWPRPLAFVLSGAGAFGSVHVGMLRALHEAGVQPDLIVGTSIGAIQGAVYSADPTAAIDRLTDTWAEMDRRQVFGRRRDVVRSLIRHRTLSDFTRLGQLIDDHLAVERFDELSTPLAAVATDAITGEPALLTSGALKPALFASAAVPGLFPVVELDGNRYLDGGVTANVPIRQAIAFGARSIVSLDATPAIFATELPGGMVKRSLHTVSLMLRSQRSHAIDELAHRYPIVELPSPTPTDMGSFNFEHTADLLTRSYTLAAHALSQWSSEAVDTAREH